jgi:3-isopropylmalate/(R)-2-methylmalate dehydratase large subunit
MGMTVSEKILAKAVGKKKVEPGEVIRATPCFSTSHDFYTYPTWTSRLDRAGMKKLANPERVAVVADHFIPATTLAWANNHRGLRNWVEKFGVKYFYYGEGISHQIMAEKGHALPGEFLASDDFECTTLGGVGSFAAGIGTSILEAYALGNLWLRVPASVKVELTGSLRKGVTPRDVSQKVIGDIGDGGALYAAIEFAGPAIEEFSIDDRMSLCGRIVYTGAKTAIVNPDSKAVDYAKGRAKAPFDPVVSDTDAKYFRVLKYNLSELEPILAAPPSPVNSQPLSKFRGTRIDQAYIGSCASGRLDELRRAAKILKNRRVAPHVKFIVAPSSSEIFKGLSEEGLLKTFLDSGAIMGSPGCGVCFGSYGGLLASGEVCISTTTNNVTGRMGSPEAQIYLGSPETVAASAIEGKIADPRDYL